MGKQLIVTLRPDGTVGAETVGMTGEECLDYISSLENLLEATTVESSFTADYAATSNESSTSQSQTDSGR